MSMIDTQNAKQIRDPMDVLITMELPDEGVTLTYSGYSTAKVADGELGETAWPMRQIADLQGEGFPLDGSHVLYNPSTPASAANGKIGVRSNIGETVTVTVTANRSVASLTIFATGASSVEYNGQTAAIVGGSVVIPVGATSVTLTFNPVSETERIEVSDITAGTTFRITNDSLIKAVVSLRSDLSLFGQTLPESEINIDVYQDADISEVVAAIPEDTPITYRAGYPGDMSPVRKFYVSGKVTWADNVLHIQGVDAVHFLDKVRFGAPKTSENIREFFGAITNLLVRANIDFNSYGERLYSGYARWFLLPDMAPRDYVAFCNNYMNLTDANGALLDGTGTLIYPLQFTYVDAGMPTVHFSSRMRSYNARTIDESDCAAVSRATNTRTTQIKGEIQRCINPDAYVSDATVQKVGTATMIKDVGVSLNFETYARWWRIGVFLGANYDNDNAQKLLSTYGTIYGSLGLFSVIPGDAGEGIQWNVSGVSPYVRAPGEDWEGYKLPYRDLPQTDFSPSTVYTAFVPWSAPYRGPWNYDGVHLIRSMQDAWNVLAGAGIMNAYATSIDLDMYGVAYEFAPQIFEYTAGDGGDTHVYSDLPIRGAIDARTPYGTPVNLYPEKALCAPMYRSNKTISFTWKGDPRIQPRDVFTFRELDGTADQWTFENITLTHEKGGTLAEITARKGVI